MVLEGGTLEFKREKGLGRDICVWYARMHTHVGENVYVWNIPEAIT